jgi:hypothetical protein
MLEAPEKNSPQECCSIISRLLELSMRPISYSTVHFPDSPTRKKFELVHDCYTRWTEVQQQSLLNVTLALARANTCTIEGTLGRRPHKWAINIIHSAISRRLAELRKRQSDMDTWVRRQGFHMDQLDVFRCYSESAYEQHREKV